MNRHEPEDKWRPTELQWECESCGALLSSVNPPMTCEHCGHQYCTECQTPICAWCNGDGCPNCMTKTVDGWAHKAKCAKQLEASEDAKDAKWPSILKRIQEEQKHGTTE